MTQPAVSLAIKELEQHYGVVLFDRIGRRLKITEAGQRLMEYSSHIVSLFDSGISAAVIAPVFNVIGCDNF